MLPLEVPLANSSRSDLVIAFLAGLVLLAGLLGASPVAAQITGRVTDNQGRAIPDASVEAWGANSTLAVRGTDSAGRFLFPADIADRTVSIYVRRIGYRAARVQVEPGRSNYEIRMADEPLTIEGVVVETEADFCSRDEDEGARRIWAATRDRYSDAVDTLGIATYLAADERLVSLDEIAPLQLPEMGYRQRGSSSLLRFSWRRWIEDKGYARSIRRNGPMGAFASWAYPPLEADFAPHFVDELFGRVHDFVLLDENAEGWVLGFCPEDDDEPHIRGRLRISPDTVLLWSEWQFVTEDPDENAGGRAVFPAVAAEGGGAFLLPSEGLFWRRTPGGAYQLTHQKFEGWLVSQGDSVPFLPVRKERSEGF